MQATDIIRDSVKKVAEIRQTAAETPGLEQAIHDVKHLQARRFAGTYADLLQSNRHRHAALFFLDELYGAKDFSERDTQFARIAGALDRIFPKQVVQTALSLAQLHLLTEDLDMAMARSWLACAEANEAARYVSAWRKVGRREDRVKQLQAVVTLGRELSHLTSSPALRVMLRMMRGPATLAGLRALQRFLEVGFDTFSAMGTEEDGASYFLTTVESRESELLSCLYESNTSDCETKILGALAQEQKIMREKKRPVE